MSFVEHGKCKNRRFREIVHGPANFYSSATLATSRDTSMITMLWNPAFFANMRVVAAWNHFW
jgi:hypothetical protein